MTVELSNNYSDKMTSHWNWALQNINRYFKTLDCKIHSLSSRATCCHTIFNDFTLDLSITHRKSLFIEICLQNTFINYETWWMKWNDWIYYYILYKCVDDKWFTSSHVPVVALHVPLLAQIVRHVSLQLYPKDPHLQPDL